MSRRRHRARRRQSIQTQGVTGLLMLASFLAHLGVGVAVLYVDVTVGLVILCALSTVVRLWAVSAGYHRYFTHRAFKTGRAFELFLAVLAQTSGQRGVLWWASRERLHHAHADRAEDVHSPSRHGLVQAHLTWYLLPEGRSAILRRIEDLADDDTLVLLERFWWVPTAAYGMLVWLLFGWPGFVWGYLVSTMLVLHLTSSLASLAHRLGSRRHGTPDTSRNSLWLALLTLGEGWHNNHHAVPGSARMGWRRGELDPTWWTLVLLQRAGVIWDVRAARSRRAPDEDDNGDDDDLDEEVELTEPSRQASAR